ESAPSIGGGETNDPDTSGNGRRVWPSAGWRQGQESPTGVGGFDQMSLFVARRAEDEGPREDDEFDPVTRLVPPVMCQVHNTYIFAESRDGLIIVDQHSAHERVLYEELRRRWDSPEQLASQRLLFPLTLRLSAAELDLVEQLQGLFARIGFEIEPFGTRSIIVHAVPNPHPYFDAERCLRDMIRELTEGSELVDAARNQHERL